jgi:hypothetical protein
VVNIDTASFGTGITVSVWGIGQFPIDLGQWCMYPLPPYTRQNCILTMMIRPRQSPPHLPRPRQHSPTIRNRRRKAANHLRDHGLRRRNHLHAPRFRVQGVHRRDHAGEE